MGAPDIGEGSQLVREAAGGEGLVLFEARLEVVEVLVGEHVFSRCFGRCR